MATIDSNIALGVKPLQVENPMNQYAALSQIQNAQNQNALAQFQLSTAKRTEEGQNALSGAYQKAYNAETGKVDNALLAKEIANSGHGYLIPKVQQEALARQKEEATYQKTIAETTGLEFKNKNDKANKAITDIAALNTPQEAIASIDKHLAKGDIDQDKADMLKAQITQTPFPKWKQSTIMGILSAQEKLKAEHDIKMADIAGGNLAVNQGQLAIARNKFNFDTDINTQVDLANKKAAAAEIGKAAGQATVALPGAITTGEEAIRKIDALIGTPAIKDANNKIIVPGTKPHAGFEQAIGAGIPGLKYIPGSSTASFMARLEEVQGGAFLQAFNTLKGGGAISEKEGTKATQAITRMSTSQSEKEFKEAAREFQDVIRKGIINAKIKANAGNNGGAPNTNVGVAPPPGFVPDNN